MTTTIDAITWDVSTSDPENLMFSLIVDFEQTDGYEIVPFGNYAPLGQNQHAAGIVCDNLTNRFPITITCGPLVETIPAYQKSLVALNKNSPLVTVMGAGLARLTFFTGIWRGTAVGSNLLEAYKVAVIQSRTGIIEMWPGLPNAIPTGTMLCVGTEINRNTYSALFSVLGTRFGAGDGLTTFNIPDFSRRMPVGADITGTRNLAGKGGAEKVSLTANENGPHTHAINDPGHAHAASSGNNTHSHTASAANNTHSHTATTSSDSHNHTATTSTNTHNHTGSTSSDSHNHTATTSNDTHNHSGTTAADSHSHSGSTSTDSHSHWVASSQNEGTDFDYGLNIANSPAVTTGRTQRANTSSDSHNHTISTSTNTHDHSFGTSSDTHNHTLTTSSDAHAHTFTTGDNSHNHTLTTSSDAHSHTLTTANYTHAHDITVDSVTHNHTISVATNTTGISAQNSGTGAAHENMPPWLGVYFIIWTGEA